MTREEIKEKLVKFETPARANSGGQTCGLMDTSVDLILEEMEIRLHIGVFRSQLKNKELALKMLNIAFDADGIV